MAWVPYVPSVSNDGGTSIMSTWETASLAYLSAGVACWLVLTVAYVRIGLQTSNRPAAAKKVAIALPVIALWPLLVMAIVRNERAQRRSRSLPIEQDEPSRARPDRVEGR
jgi:hypothetical protein